jgi:Arc/MetJ-type ribon-helix-helix transcriptional regulator
MTRQLRSEIISVRLTARQLEILENMAEREFLTQSEVIRVALAEYLARRGTDINAYRGDPRGPWAPQAS